ncbi:MAG: serine/threonine protein kinase, partial [Gammaproteobacteria bacterium]|nr:serine/threonine protein kinase [Gammaproteobacteria bacterium]
MTANPESIINKRYILQAKLGEGGMGVVHRALDRLTGNIVALKQIQVPTETLQFMSMPPLEFAADLRLSLAREFQTLASLRHPHIISVLDYGFVPQADEEPQPFYTMTYLSEAGTLLRAGQGLSVPAKLGLLQQTLQGLAYLHRRGILHQDLKPENVLVAEGRVQILDFGLAARQDESEVGSSGGSIAYLAPELWREQVPSPASDLYAVGVMAYELLAGQHPFAPIDRFFLERVLDSEPDLSLLAGVEGLAQVIAKLLVKEPKARYQRAAEVLIDLNATLGEAEPVESEA